MIYFFSALYMEARPLIEAMHLRKDPSFTAFQIFRNDTVCLTVTGVGAAAASAAAAHVFTRIGPGCADFLINFGSCALIPENENIDYTNIESTVYICRKILEAGSGRCFYPDMFFKSPFDEAELITGQRAVDKNNIDNIESRFCSVPIRSLRENCHVPLLYDMEAAALYQAANYFIGPGQMIFLKTVSDVCDPQDLSPDKLYRICSEHIGETVKFAEKLAGISEMTKTDDEKCRGQLCEDMHCSETMKEMLAAYSRYFSAAGIDFDGYLAKLYGDGTLPCRDKRAGCAVLKRIHDELVLK